MSGDMQDLCEILERMLVVLTDIGATLHALVPKPADPTPVKNKP
jgi:hypothetical protein